LLLDTNITACPTRLGSIPGISSVRTCIGLTTELPVRASHSEVPSHRLSRRILRLSSASGASLRALISFFFNFINSVLPLNLGLFI